MEMRTLIGHIILQHFEEPQVWLLWDFACQKAEQSRSEQEGGRLATKNRRKSHGLMSAVRSGFSQLKGPPEGVTVESNIESSNVLR